MSMLTQGWWKWGADYKFNRAVMVKVLDWVKAHLKEEMPEQDILDRLLSAWHGATTSACLYASCMLMLARHEEV